MSRDPNGRTQSNMEVKRSKVTVTQGRTFGDYAETPFSTCVGQVAFQLSVTTLRSAYDMSRPSVVCLSSVTLLHTRQRIVPFGNIFAPSNSSGTQTVCIKILGKNSKGIVQVKYREYENWRFFHQCLALFRKLYKIRLYMYTVFRKKPLLFSCITLRKSNQFK